MRRFQCRYCDVGIVVLSEDCDCDNPECNESYSPEDLEEGLLYELS